MQFPVSKHCDCFQYAVRHGLPGKWWTCVLQLYRRQLAVSHHSHKIVVLSALGRLVSHRNNSSFSSVNPPLWGLYFIQLRLCQILSECEAFDCCKLVCYRQINKFVLVFVSRKESQATSQPFYFNINRPIRDLIFLRRQGSPYQAVTGKIYRLWEHLLPPANAQKSYKIRICGELIS